MDEREHLYRDDANAALERASRLAEENEALKRELAHYRSFPRGEVPTLRTRRPVAPPVVAALAASVSFLIAGIAIIIVSVEEPAPVVIEPPLTSTHARAAVTPYERPAMTWRFKHDEAPTAIMPVEDRLLE